MMNLLRATRFRRIRAKRAMLGWSQADLAQKAGLSMTTISAIEGGHVTPTMETLEKIAKAFRCSVSSLEKGSVK